MAVCHCARVHSDGAPRLGITDDSAKEHADPACRTCHGEGVWPEATIERERVQQVFGLTGGELSDTPWIYTEGGKTIAYSSGGEDHPYKYEYWYDGLPDYVESREYPDKYTAEYRTVITNVMYGDPTPPDGWEFVVRFLNSGETECFCKSDEANDGEADDGCPFCEGDGLIYLGDGEAEVVFRKIAGGADDDDDEEGDEDDDEEYEDLCRSERATLAGMEGGVHASNEAMGSPLDDERDP